MAGLLKTRIILIGIGGATCSGKTTLAKHLRRLLPDSVIIHQDDFAPPQELVPFHPIHNVQDWDMPAGAIDWSRMVSFLHTVKETGEIPAEHRSHDHLNEQKEFPISEALEQQWTEKFATLKSEAHARGEKVVWGIVDGFLLYWHQDIIDALDIRIFLHLPEEVLKERRHARHGYHTAVQSDLLEGSLWRDPPHYWEQIVYPAYVEAHKDIFQDGDVEKGVLGDKIPDLTLLQPLVMDTDGIVNQTCSVVYQSLEK